MKNYNSVVRLKDKNNMLLYLLFLSIIYIFISYMLSYYELNITGFSVSLNFILMIGIIIVILGIACHNILTIKTCPLILVTATVFLIFSLVSTFVNSNIQNEDLLIVVAKQSMWWAVFIGTYLFINNKETISRFINFCFGFFLIISIIYFMNINIISHSSEPGAISSIYYIILFLPMLLILKDTKIKNISIIICVALTLLSEKRTALLIMIISFFVYEIILIYLYKRENRKKIYAILGVFVFLIAFFLLYNILIENYNVTVFDRMKLLQNDGGSNRVAIYSAVWNKIIGSSFPDLLLGRGFNGVYLSGAATTSAHNDFLEVIYDYGLFGFIPFILFYLGLIKINIKMIKLRHEYAPAFGVSIVILLFMSMFSHLIIYPTYILLLMIFWGISINSLFDKKQKGN